MDAKLKKIQLIIDYAGLPSPTPDEILLRIKNVLGDTDDEIINHLIKKYKEYVFAYRIQNYMTENNFIKMELRLVNFDKFIFTKRYLKEFPVPKTKLIKAMLENRDFFELYDRFISINNSIKNKRNKGLKKLENYEKENKRNHE